MLLATLWPSPVGRPTVALTARETATTGAPSMVIREAMDLNTNSTKLTLATLPISLQEDGGAT